jgi:8-oxo-dGTP pyrophosphatase MutT (NUDIX family)
LVDDGEETLLRGRFPLSHTPEIVSKLTREESAIIERILEHGHTEYVKVMDAMYGTLLVKDRETPWLHFTYASPLLRKSLDRYAEPAYTKPTLPYLWAKGYKLYNSNETDIECALRELKEESGFTQLPSSCQILTTPIQYSQDGFFGTYTTICWIAIFPNEIPIPNPEDNDIEVSDRRWMTLEDACEKMSDIEARALRQAQEVVTTTQ